MNTFEKKIILLLAIPLLCYGGWLYIQVENERVIANLDNTFSEKLNVEFGKQKHHFLEEIKKPLHPANSTWGLTDSIWAVGNCSDIYKPVLVDILNKDYRGFQKFKFQARKSINKDCLIGGKTQDDTVRFRTMRELSKNVSQQFDSFISYLTIGKIAKEMGASPASIQYMQELFAKETNVFDGGKAIKISYNRAKKIKRKFVLKILKDYEKNP